MSEPTHPNGYPLSYPTEKHRPDPLAGLGIGQDQDDTDTPFSAGLACVLIAGLLLLLFLFILSSCIGWTCRPVPTLDSNGRDSIPALKLSCRQN